MAMNARDIGNLRIVNPPRKLRYVGPYKIEEDVGQGTFVLSDVFGTRVPKVVNGFRLKPFIGQPPNVQGIFESKHAARDQLKQGVQAYGLLNANSVNLNLNYGGNIFCEVGGLQQDISIGPTLYFVEADFTSSAIYKLPVPSFKRYTIPERALSVREQNIATQTSFLSITLPCSALYTSYHLFSLGS